MKRQKKNPNELKDLIEQMKSLDPNFESHLIKEIKSLIKLINRIEFNKLCKSSTPK